MDKTLGKGKFKPNSRSHLKSYVYTPEVVANLIYVFDIFLLSTMKCTIRKITVQTMVVSFNAESSQWKLPSHPHLSPFPQLWPAFSAYQLAGLQLRSKLHKNILYFCDFLVKNFLHQWGIRRILSTSLQKAKVFLQPINMSDNVGHWIWCYQPQSQYFKNKQHKHQGNF